MRKLDLLQKSFCSSPDARFSAPPEESDFTFAGGLLKILPLFMYCWGAVFWSKAKCTEYILIQLEDTEILRQKMVLLASLKNRA